MTIQILTALTSTIWGKQNQLSSQHTKPILEYVSTIWSPLASDTNINKLQITQNTALRIATVCTTETNTHLHDETHILPIKDTTAKPQTPYHSPYITPKTILPRAARSTLAQLRPNKGPL